jgi:virulence-associated protein VapD
MFAISFDLVVAEVLKAHPKGVAPAYAEIGHTLRQFGFKRIQGSVYVTENEDMANLFSALLALRALSWFPTCVRDIRAFRIEQWSDFTPIMKEEIKKKG